MSKKKLKEPLKNKPRDFQNQIGITKRGLKIIVVGIFSLIFGFILLGFSNSEGDNLASVVSPFIIIFSYVLIGIGIITK